MLFYPFGLRIIIILISVAMTPLALAQAPKPIELPLLTATTPILIVTGEQDSRQYSLAELEALGLYTVTTATFWPEDDGSYQGVLLSDVLADAGLANAEAVNVLALDHFSQTIPRQDWTRWPLLLATRRDQQPLSIRSKGPLRIIYPRDMDSELERGTYRLRWVWMIDRLTAVKEGYEYSPNP